MSVSFYRMNATPTESGYRLLVVDDEAGLRDMLSFCLPDRGFVVTAAGDANEAVQKVAESDFDIVICDIMMPDCDGLELLKTLKSMRPEMAVIMATGSPTQATQEESARRGACGYVPKPFDLDQLCVTVVNACRKGGPSRTASA